MTQIKHTVFTCVAGGSSRNALKGAVLSLLALAGLSGSVPSALAEESTPDEPSATQDELLNCYNSDPACQNGKEFYETDGHHYRCGWDKQVCPYNYPYALFRID
jgi:hypothetical protein